MATPEISLLLELILDLKKDITSLKENITDLKTEAAKNTVTLEDHARRSTASEARLGMLEQRDQMLNGFFKISLGILGVVASVIGVIAAIRHL